MEKAARATQLDLEAAGILLPSGFRIEHVAVSVPQPVLPLGPLRASVGTAADIRITVLADDVATYLEGKQPSGLSAFRVTAENGKLRVVATVRLMLPMEVGAEGTLNFVDGKLSFVPSRTEIAGVGAPEGLVREQLDKINPLIDITGWPAVAAIHAIDLADGRITLHGKLTLTADIPRREP
jgi:hypothetical protein